MQQAPAARLKRHSVHSVPRGRRPWAGGEPVLEKQTEGGSEDACTAAAPGSMELSGIEQGLKRLHGRVRSAQVA